MYHIDFIFLSQIVTMISTNLRKLSLGFFLNDNYFDDEIIMT